MRKTYKQTSSTVHDTLNNADKKCHARIVRIGSGNGQKVPDQVDKGNQKSTKANGAKAGRQCTLGTSPHWMTDTIVQKVHGSKDAC